MYELAPSLGGRKKKRSGKIPHVFPRIYRWAGAVDLPKKYEIVKQKLDAIIQVETGWMEGVPEEERRELLERDDTISEMQITLCSEMSSRNESAKFKQIPQIYKLVKKLSEYAEEEKEERSKIKELLALIQPVQKQVEWKETGAAEIVQVDTELGKETGAAQMVMVQVDTELGKETGAVEMVQVDTELGVDVGTPGTVQEDAKPAEEVEAKEEDNVAADMVEYEFKRREPITEKNPLLVTEVREDQKERAPPTISPDYVGRHHDDIEHEAIRYFIRRGDFR